jgi:hypothetical protein
MSLLLCLGLCVPLAACASANAAHQMASPEPASAGRAAHAQAAAKKKEKKEKKEEQTDEWWQEGGVTREKINAMCWMKIENAGRRDMAAEKRADLVNTCVEQTLKEHPLR